MRFLRRAAIWTLLAGAGLVPLSACGDDTGGRAPVKESPMPPKAPTDGRKSGTASPDASADETDTSAGSLPLTGAATGAYTGGAAKAPETPPASGGVETRTIAIQSGSAEIIGTLTQPAGGGRGLLVVMLHGYTGDRDEFAIPSTGEGLFERAARRFAEAGIPSFRFDFAGSGQSGGAWRDTTFSGQARDTREVLGYLRRVQGYGDTPIALLGFSQGGLVALKVAAGGTPVSRMALWNPVLDPQRTYSGILGADQVQNGLKLAQAGKTGEVVGSTRLAAGFFADVHNTDPIRDAAAWGGPMLIVSGTRDTVAASGPELARKVRAGRGGPTELLVVPGDHGFDALRGTARVDQAIEATIRFLLAGAGG